MFSKTEFNSNREIALRYFYVFGGIFSSVFGFICSSELNIEPKNRVRCTFVNPEMAADIYNF